MCDGPWGERDCPACGRYRVSDEVILVLMDQGQSSYVLKTRGFSSACGCEARVIIESKVALIVVGELGHWLVKQTSLNICTHLFKFFTKSVVLNCPFAGICLTFWFRLGGISRYSVRVKPQLFLHSRLQQRT